MAAKATKRNPVRAGQMLRERREELGLTQADVVAQGGPSAMTLRSIENGVSAEPRTYTIAALERVLGLPRGTYEKVATGGVLPPLEADPADDLRRQAAALLHRAERAERTETPTAVRSLRLPDDLWDQAVAHADLEGRPPSAVIRDAIRDYLERNGR